MLRPICEPKQSPALQAARDARQRGRRDSFPACDADLANRFVVALQEARAMLVSFGAPGHSIAAPRRRRQVADGARILGRDERAAELAGEAGPPR
jgi:hypothetical protein